MVGAAQFGADGGAHRPAHCRHAAHGHKVARAGGLPEGNQVAPAAAGVVEGDGSVGVNGLVQLVDDAVAVGGGCRVVEAGAPFVLVLFVALADFIYDFRLDAAGIRPQAFPHGVDDGAQGQFGVGQHWEVDLVGFVEVGGVGVDVDDADAIGYGAAVGAVGLAEGVAHGQHHIGFAVDLEGGAGGVAAAGIDAAAEGQGVIFGEGALAHNGGGHGHRQEFGQFQHFIGGAGAHGPAAGVEDGQFGVEQQVGGALHIGIGGAGFARSADGGVGQGGVIGFGGQDILGHFQHYRAGRAGAEGGESAAHYPGDVLDAGEGAAPFAEAVKDAGRDFLLPFLAQVAEGVLAHQQEDGDVVGVAAGDGGEAVGGAGGRCRS